MRAKIATIAVVIIGLISIYQPLIPRLLRVSSENELLVVLDRARCLKDALPRDVHKFGSLPPVSLIISSDQSPLETGNQLRRLFIMRYMVTPDLVSSQPDAQWVIGYYPNRETGLKDLQGQNWTIVKDCENGAFLLKR